MKQFIYIAIFFGSHLVQAQSLEGWNQFARVRFTAKFFKEFNEYFLVPLFDDRIKAMEGKEITIRGYYMPIELESKNTLILSKYPYSQCFFCGGAGPESVAEIVFPKSISRLMPDQLITVKGILYLNESDVNHMTFILKEATLVN